MGKSYVEKEGFSLFLVWSAFPVCWSLVRDPSAKFTNKVAMHESILLESASGFCLFFEIITVEIIYCSSVTSIIIYKNRQYMARRSPYHIYQQCDQLYGPGDGDG